MAFVQDDLTLDNVTVYLGNASGTNSGKMYFEGTQALGGTGTVLLGDSGGNLIGDFRRLG